MRDVESQLRDYWSGLIADHPVPSAAALIDPEDVVDAKSSPVGAGEPISANGTMPVVGQDSEILVDLDQRPETKDNTMSTKQWLLIGAAAALVLIAGIVAISVQDDDQGLDTVATPESPTTVVPTPTPTPTSAPPTTVVPTTTPAPEVLDVAAQIRAYFDARNSALAAPVPDPDESLQFDQFAEGEALSNLNEDVQGFYEAGRATRPGEEGLGDVRVGFVDARSSAASAVACEVNDGVLYEVATGNVVNDDVVTRELEIFLTMQDGVWKLESVRGIEQWDDVAGCALSPDDYPL